MDEEKKEVEVVETEETKTEPKSTQSKGFSITAMVLGILSVVLLCYWPLALICAILAIIFGVMGRKKEGKGMATAGFVLGIVSICLFVLMIIFAVVLGTAFLSAAPSIVEELESLNATYTY